MKNKKSGLPDMSPRMARLWRDIHPDRLSLLEAARRREHNLTTEELYPKDKARWPDFDLMQHPLAGISRNSDQKD